MVGCRLALLQFWVVLVLVAVSTARADEPRTRIQTHHAQFFDGSRVFHPAGGTLYLMQGEQPRREAIKAVERAGQSGLNTLRVWLFSEGPSRAPLPWERLFYFRMGPTGFVEDTDASPFRLMDEVITSAERWNLRLILVFGNHWNAYGGIARYREWFLGSPAMPGAPATGPAPTDDELAFFYSDPRAQAAYRQHAQRWLDRRHPNGLLYKNHSTILGAEILNEPRPAPRIRTVQRAWFQKTARWFKELAPDVLLSTGAETGLNSSDEESQHWKTLALIPQIDWLDLHLYPGEGSSWTPNSMPDYLARVRGATDYAKNVVHKPLLLSELGISASASARLASGPTGSHACVDTGACLVEASRQARLNAGASGVLLWILRLNGGLAGEHWVDLGKAESQSWLQPFAALKAQ